MTFLPPWERRERRDQVTARKNLQKRYFLCFVNVLLNGSILWMITINKNPKMILHVLPVKTVQNMDYPYFFTELVLAWTGGQDILTEGNLFSCSILVYVSCFGLRQLQVGGLGECVQRKKTTHSPSLIGNKGNQTIMAS